MQPITVTVGPLTAANDDEIAQADTLVAPGDFSLNGDPVVLDAPRRVSIAGTGDNTGVNFTVYGTTYGGHEVSETVTGANNGAVSTTVDFKTVSRVYADAATDGNVVVGTNSVAGSSWVRLDSWAFPQTAIQCNASGTVNYTVQISMDDPNSPTNPVAITDMTWLNTNDADAVTAVGNVFTNFDWTPTWARVLLNSGSGDVEATFAQFNAVSK